MNFLSMEFEIPLVSLIFILFLIIIFYSKKRVDLVENKVFEIILITSFISAVFDTIVHIISALYSYEVLITEHYFIVDIINKIVATSFVLIFTSLLCYVLLISYRKFRENPKPLWILLAIVSIVFFIIVNFFHVTVTEAEFSRNTTGFPIIFAYVIVAIDLLLALILSVKNFKKNDKRYYTIFLIATMMLVLYILSVLFRGLIIYDLILALLCYIMYFTLENPDMQMINILIRNKELVEQTVNDKSNLLFKISQEMKKPIQNIVKNVRLYKDEFSKEETKLLISNIEAEANSAYFIINDIASVSSLDVKNFKVSDNRYRTDKLFLEIKSNVTNQLSLKKKTDKIKFNLNVTNKYPEYLYGDIIKLKQVILSIVNNSIKYTDEGFIDIDVDIITRYDACRMIFTIKDSGCGMNLYTINSLLSSNEELTAEEFNKIDSLDMKIPVVIKILKLLGGSISIKSEESKGTIVVVVVNQAIDFDSTSEFLFKESKKYNSGIKVRKRVLVADDSEDLDKIERILSKNDLDVVTTLIGKDVIDKVQNGDNYDLIILKDDLRPDTAYSILKKLQEDKKFKTPVIITIDKNQEFIKDHFIKDGFSDVITRDKIDSQLPKIISKYM